MRSLNGFHIEIEGPGFGVGTDGGIARIGERA